MVNRVVIGKQAQKQLRKIPLHIREAFRTWVAAVTDRGLAEVRKVPGYHDEPLSGDRAGQRSVRLNRGWRAFYVQRADGTVEFVEVIEVNHHDY